MCPQIKLLCPLFGKSFTLLNGTPIPTHEFYSKKMDEITYEDSSLSKKIWFKSRRKSYITTNNALDIRILKVIQTNLTQVTCPKAGTISIKRYFI